jgi:hypothetical protein
MIRFELRFESNGDMQNKIVSVTKENAQLMGQKKWDRAFSYRG